MGLTKMNQSRFDVVIVGGGMVGAVQAQALLRQGMRVLLLETQVPEESWLERPPLRVSAINLFSESLLQELRVWSHIGENAKCKFTRLATWDKPENKLVFSADEIDSTHLGFLVRNEALQLAAFKAFQSFKEAGQLVVSTAAILSIVNEERQVTLGLKDEDTNIELTADLLIGADGANSRVRQLLNIGTSGWQYRQHCFSVTIKTEFPKQDITWQQFQPSGPKAFLPLSDGFASLIWYDAPETIAKLKSLSQEDLKQQVLEVFPALPGDFSVVQHASFPLTRRQANNYFVNRVVLVGDAAHTINPLAGQGVNLGFKDVAMLTECLGKISLADSAHLASALKKYECQRKTESRLMSGVMDACYQLFSNEDKIKASLRNGFLSMANKSGWVKKQVLKKAVGL